MVLSRHPEADQVSVPPYDEDTIVELLTKIWYIYIDLCYLPENIVVFPPSNDSRTGHDFPQNILDLFQSLSLSPTVISLLKRIPYVHEGMGSEYEIYPSDTQFICYTDEDTIRFSRDPNVVELDEIKYDYLMSTDIALTQFRGRDGHMLILNVEESFDDQPLVELNLPFRDSFVILENGFSYVLKNFWDHGPNSRSFTTELDNNTYQTQSLLKRLWLELRSPSTILRAIDFDTQANVFLPDTIRDYGFYNNPDIPSPSSSPGKQERRAQFPFPDIFDHYRNYPAVSAPYFLQCWIDDLRNLVLLPFLADHGYYYLSWGPQDNSLYPDTDLGRIVAQHEAKREDSEDQIFHKDLKRVLQEDYGWPDNFRKEDWKRDQARISYEVTNRYRPTSEAAGSD